MFSKLILCISIIIAVPLVYASEIVDTRTTTGEVLYLVNCTAPCTVKLYDMLDNLLAESNHSGYEWGDFSGLDGGVYNLTLWEGGAIVDQKMVNLGMFNVTLTKQLEERLGKKTVGYAIMFGIGISAVMLGFEGGFMLVGIALMISADEGFVPGWLVYLIYLIGAIMLGIGIYGLIGGLK